MLTATEPCPETPRRIHLVQVYDAPPGDEVREAVLPLCAEHDWPE